MSSPSPRTSAQIAAHHQIGDERRQHGVAQEPRVDVGAHQRHEDQAGDRQRHRQAGDELDVVVQALRTQPKPMAASRKTGATTCATSRTRAHGVSRCDSFAAVHTKPSRAVDRMSTALYYREGGGFFGSAGMLRVSAKFALGQVVRHRVHPFRGVIFDVDPDLQQHQRVVGVDPRGKPAAQGPAVLPPARRERDLLLRGLRLGAEPGARRLGRPGRPSGGLRDVRRAARGRPLRPRRPPALTAPSTSPRTAARSPRPAVRADHVVAVVLRAPSRRRGSAARGAASRAAGRRRQRRSPAAARRCRAPGWRRRRSGRGIGGRRGRRRGRSPGRPPALAVPRSRDIAIQPASVIVQPFSRWWPITVGQHRERDLVGPADPDAGLEEVEEHADAGAELGQPVEASARSSGRRRAGADHRAGVPRRPQDRRGADDRQPLALRRRLERRLPAAA